jgi:hypothetical protein
LSHGQNAFPFVKGYAALDYQISGEAFWHETEVGRRDQERVQEIIRYPDNTREATMTDFRTKLTQLDAGEFLDVVGDVVREQTRRSTNKPPGELTDHEYRLWCDMQIKKAEQAKAAEAAKEQTDG